MRQEREKETATMARQALPQETPRGIIKWIRSMIKSANNKEAIAFICTAAWNDATCPWILRGEIESHQCKRIARALVAFARKHSLPTPIVKA